MILEKYFDRINYTGNNKANLESLFELHKCHVLSIPFENLDIHMNKEIKLDLESLFEKIILNKRGGFCYELNFLFFNLLKKIGFNCKLVSSRIYDDHEKLGPEFDHLSIIVTLEDNYLVDVGYGDLFIEPIKLVDSFVKKDWFKFYKIIEMDKSTWLLSESKDGNIFKERYQIDETPRTIEAFFDQCKFKQYSENSYFVQNKICTIPTKDGRITLRNNQLIERVGASRVEHEIVSDIEFYKLLEERFKINLVT